MSNRMRYAPMLEKRVLKIENANRPVPGPGEVLIEVKSVGVCGSDLHYYTQGKIGDLEVEMPFLLGHEVAGVVAQLGPEVSGLKVGDRVAVEAGVPCGNCEFCANGQYNICKKMRFMATPPIHGAFAEYIVHPAKWLYPLPDNVSFEEGALIEPLAVGMHSAELSNLTLGNTAFIFGCGCIGLVTLLALKARGVAQIYMCDCIPKRMEKAKELGATKVYDIRQKDIAESVLQDTGGRGVDGAFEMTGAPTAVMQTSHVIRQGGTIVMAGLGSEGTLPFNFAELIWKEGQVKTCFRYRHIYPLAIRSLQAGTIPIQSIVTHRFPFTSLPQAMEYHIEHKSDIVKMVIHMEKDKGVNQV